MFLSLMKKDICQRQCAAATSYYSAVMHECGFVCRTLRPAKLMRHEHTIFKNREIHAEDKFTSLNFYRDAHTVSVQLCQQVHIYLKVLW